jgi:hypothetical protein
MAFQNIAGRLVDVIFGYDFFVSYTWADGSKYAHSLYEKLKAQGFTVFLDEEEYARGDNWTLLGRRALKKTRQLVLVVTPRVHESAPVLKELIAFQSTGRRIIPVEIGDSLNTQKYPESPLLPLIPAELLKVSQPLEEGKIPNEVPSEVIRDLRKGFQHVRQAQKRIRFLLAACLVLLGLLSIAVWQAISADLQRKKAVQASREANRQLAEASWLIAQGTRGSLYSSSEESPIKAAHYLLRAANAAAAAKEIPDAQNASHAANVTGASIFSSMVHDGAVRGVTTSPDGQRILSWSQDGTARLWNASNGKAVGEPMKHEKLVDQAIYSPDGQRILSWSPDGTARLWNASSGKPVGQPMKHEGAVSGATYSPDRQRILTWTEDGTVRLWNAENGQAAADPIKHADGLIVMGALYSPDGTRILTWSDDNAARLWNASDGKAAAEPLKHQKNRYIGLITGGRSSTSWNVGGATYSPDKQRILTSSDDGTARLWNASDGHPVGQPMEHEHELGGEKKVGGAIYSPDKRRIVTWCEDGTVRFWKANDGKTVGKPVAKRGYGTRAMAKQWVK